MVDAEVSQFERRSGVIIPFAAMPRSGDRQGTYSKMSINMLRILRDAGFSILHDVPLSPPDENNCPYSSTSSFAVDPGRIDLQILENMGDIPKEVHDKYMDFVLASTDPESGKITDQKGLRSTKDNILRDAYQRFKESGSASRKAEFDEWREKQKYWLDGFATYEILKTHPENLKEDENEKGKFVEQRWQDWSYGKDYSDELVADVKRDFEEEFSAISYVQWIAERQALKFKALARRFGIEIWGDVPFYTGPADVWANRYVFNLDEDGEQLDQGGAPPSDTKTDGQIWGNATYFFDLDADPERSEKVLDWWVERIERINYLTGGVVRLDHFLALAEVYIINKDAKTGEEGVHKLERSMGYELLTKLREKHGNKNIIYPEDLGNKTLATLILRRAFGLLSSSVSSRGLTKHLRRGANQYETSEYNPDNIKEDTVEFTSNHDMEPIVQSLGIVRDENPEAFELYVQKLQKIFPNERIGSDSSLEELAKLEMVRVMNSVAKVAFIAIWDLLHLGKEGRYNRPGHVLPENWFWHITNEHVRIFEEEISYWQSLNISSGRYELTA